MNSLKIKPVDLHMSGQAFTRLSEVIGHYEKELAEAGQVVCQFSLNGMKLTEQDEARFADLSVHDIEELEVLFQSPENLLVGLLGGWLQKIPDLITDCDKISTQIRYKGIDGHMKLLVDVIDDAQLLVDSLMSIDSLFSSFAIVSSQSWKDNENLMTAAVGQALSAFQSRDFNQLADILEYDISHSLQIWIDLLTSLQTEVNLSFEVVNTESLDQERINESNAGTSAAGGEAEST